MNFKLPISLMFPLLLIFACSKDDEREGASEQSFYTDFAAGTDNWVAGFADYNGNNVETYELKDELSHLPEPLDTKKQAYKLSGINRSDDLFMYLKKQLGGFKPLTAYRINFTIKLASDAISGGVGAGGAPGEAVGIGVGASVIEPLASANENNFYQMNIDKINQCCTDGEDMVVIGNVANGGDVYEYKMLERAGEFQVTADAEGKIWVLVGTDSGYEGKTTLYYSTIGMKITEIFD